MVTTSDNSVGSHQMVLYTAVPEGQAEAFPFAPLQCLLW